MKGKERKVVRGIGKRPENSEYNEVSVFFQFVYGTERVDPFPSLITRKGISV